MTRLRLVDIEAPLDEVEFPNGAVHTPTPFGPTEYRLWRDIQEETDAMARGRMLMQIVTACYPAATADDLDSCTPKMLIAIAAHAGRKIEQVREALKNVEAVEASATPQPPPSSPKTSGSTSSRRSRARSGKRGAASRTAPPNSSGGTTTNSPTRSASTNSDASSTTSTAP